MPVGPLSRYTPSTTIGGGTTRTSSKSRTSSSNANRPSSANLVSPRGSSSSNGGILSHYQRQDIQNTSSSYKNNTNNGSRASSISRSHSNTPGVNNSFSHNRNLLHQYHQSSPSPSTSSVTSPSKVPVPRTTQAALDEFSKPTAAAEARNASASVLVERLRNIVSKHEERDNNNTTKQNIQNSNMTTSHQQRQMEAAMKHSQQVQRGLDFDNSNVNINDIGGRSGSENDNNNNNNQKPRRKQVVPIESQLHHGPTSANRTMIGSYLEAGGSSQNQTPSSSFTNTPANSAPSSAMKPNKGKIRTAWQGGMEYSDDDADYDEYDDEEEEDYTDDDDEGNNDQQNQKRQSSMTPQRPPVMRPANASPNPRSGNVSPQQQNSPMMMMSNNNNNFTSFPTTQIPGFSWCRDWTRRGMRPEEVTFNEQNRVASEATTHVEPRGIDTWHSVFDNKQPGSFLCRRCGLPVFSSNAMSRPIARAGHITFSTRLARTTIPELCPQDGKIIIKCARCKSFLGDIYDVQSKTIPPLIRASSWCLWHDESVKVPENLSENLGPYIEEEEDGLDEDALQKMLDKVDPLTTMDDFF